MGRSLPTESLIRTSVDQQPFSNYESNKVSDKTSNGNPTSHDEFSAVESNRIAFSTSSNCCHNSANKIDNHKSITSNERKQFVQHLDVVARNQNKRKNRRPSPTQPHQIECECASSARKPHNNPIAKPCHTENRKIIKVAHKLNNDVTHSITDQSRVDANQVNASDIHTNTVNFHCLDYDHSEQCCFCCYSDCKKPSKLNANYKCDDQPVERTQLQKNLTNSYSIANDANFPTHLNNNCKFYINQNNERNSNRTSDATIETDIFEAKKCLVHDHSYYSTQFYVDCTVPPNIRRQSDKCAKFHKRKTDPTPIPKQIHLNYLQRVQSINENCSDCIGQLDKQLIKNIKRIQSVDYCPKSVPISTENVPIGRDDHQKLVCCSKNVTAVRKTATLFMIGSDSCDSVGCKSKSKLLEKSELIHDDGLVDTCQNLTNRIKFKAQYHRNADKCGETHKSIDSKNRMTSIWPAKESHSKNSNRNQIINNKIRGDRTHEQLNGDCDANQHLNWEKKQRKRNDTFGNEGVNDDNGEYLCHLEKLNLADRTAVIAVGSAASEQVEQKVAHISTTYRDENGATTTHTPAAPSLTVENEPFIVDTSKQSEQSEYYVNSIGCTDQSATVTSAQCKIIEANESGVEHVSTNEDKSDDDENTDYCASETLLLVDESAILSGNAENNTNDECTLFEHKPILNSAQNQRRIVNRRASFDDNNSVNSDFAIFVKHRRTNSSGGEGYSFDPLSKLNRSYIDSISDRFRYIQNTDHRYAHYLSPNTVSTNNSKCTRNKTHNLFCQNQMFFV